MKVPVGKNHHAIVDRDDFALVSGHKWHLRKGACGVFYATSSTYANRVKSNVSMHRLVMKAVKGQIVDHLNGNGLDNRKANLRFATAAQNTSNRHNDPKSGNRWYGIYLVPEVIIKIDRGRPREVRLKRRWQAYIRVNYKRTNIGYFATREEAISARKKFERAHGVGRQK